MGGFTTADSNLYIDMGVRLWRGFPFLGFDLYQATPGAFFPSLPYIPPLWPIIAGATFLMGGLVFVSFINMLFVVFSAQVFFLLAKRFMDIRIAFISVLTAYLTMPLLVIALYPWTEGLALFLMSVFLFVLFFYPDKNSLLGILTGMMFLTRPQYVLPMLVLSVLFFKKDRRRFWFAFILIALLYEAVCLVFFHQLYPKLYIHPTQFISKTGHNAPDALAFLRAYGERLSRLFIDPVRMLFFFSVFIALKRFWEKEDARKLIVSSLIILMTYPALFAFMYVKEFFGVLAN